ncbi:hypothetical protein ALC53_12083 [Atta colombica]|uniref:Uncharacterized protein n=1 Tax=Atta colombica TaxID=520822 RepID=A0A195AZR7_9HYME|nr:hypothetical protein ALC53_12083 [Atta colombica]
MLMNALNGLQISAKAQAFPKIFLFYFFFVDRKTPVGTILNSFLSKEINVPLEAASFIFCQSLNIVIQEVQYRSIEFLGD